MVSRLLRGSLLHRSVWVAEVYGFHIFSFNVTFSPRQSAGEWSVSET